MKPDARLVEHEQRIHQRGAQRCSQVYALHLPAAEGARLAVEGQIAKADVEQISEPGCYLLEEELHRLVERSGEVEVLEKRNRSGNGKEHELMNVEPLTAARESPQKRLRFEPGSAAVGAGRVGPVLGKQHPDVHLVAL